MNSASGFGLRSSRRGFMIVAAVLLAQVACAPNAPPEVVSPSIAPDLLVLPMALRLCDRSEGESPSFTFVDGNSTLERQTTAVFDTTGRPRMLVAQAVIDRSNGTFAGYLVVVNFESGRSAKGMLESDTAGALVTPVPSFDPDSIPGFAKLSDADYARARALADWLWLRRCVRAQPNA